MGKKMFQFLGSLLSSQSGTPLRWVAVLVLVWRIADIYRGRQNRITSYTLKEKHQALNIDKDGNSNPSSNHDYHHFGVYQRVSQIIKSCPNLCHYTPPFYLVSGLIQSIAGERVRPDKHEEPLMERETIVLKEMKKPEKAVCCPDIVPEGVVSIDWVHPVAPYTSEQTSIEDGSDSVYEGAPVVICVPGLTGDSNAPYIMTLALHLSQRGVRVACFNPRGRGGNELKSPFLYSAGYTEDLRRIVQHVCDRYPNATATIGVGFSLGSNYLAKFVGEEGDACLLSAAVMAGCPLDCLSMSNHFHHSTMGQLMDPVLVSNVQKIRLEYTHVLKDLDKVDLEHVASAKTMAEFDHRIIAPMFGFSCVSDYYRYSSAGNLLSEIRRPALFLHSENDPIVPGKYIRMDNFDVNPHLIHCMTKEGGHSMSWPMGIHAKDSWMSVVVSEFVNAVIETEKVHHTPMKQLRVPVNNKGNIPSAIASHNSQIPVANGQNSVTFSSDELNKQKGLRLYAGAATAAAVILLALFRRKWRL